MADNLPDFFTWAAQQQGLDPKLVARVIAQESAGNPKAVSPKGAQGLMQLMPGTAKEMGVQDPNDPVQNYLGGTKYLAQQEKRFGNDRDALAAYNAGPHRVAQGGPLPAETQNYLAKILGGAQSAPMQGAPQQQQAMPPLDVNDFIRKVTTGESLTPEQQAPQQSAPPDFMQWAMEQNKPVSSHGAPAEDDGPSFSGFLSNVGSSGANLVGGLANTVMHPIDTLEGLGHLAMHPGKLLDYAKERYGGLDKIGHTAYTDPVGMLADIAGIAEPTAWGAELAGLDGVASAARMASKVNPLNAIAKPVQALSTSAYGKVLSPSRAALKGIGMTTEEMAQQGLNDWVNISERGADKAGALAKQDITARNATIDRASNAGQSVRPQEVISSLPDLLKKMDLDVAPEAKTAAVNEARDEFLRKFVGPTPIGQGLVAPKWTIRNFTGKGGNVQGTQQSGMLMGQAQSLPLHGPANLRDIPLNELEKIKETTYKYTPNSAWTSEAVPPAMREARQSMGSTMKDLIEQKTQGFEGPEGSVKDLNRSYAKRSALEDMVNTRIENPGGNLRHMLELLGGMAGGHAMGGMGLALLDNPRVVSNLANVGYRAPTAAKALAPFLALQRVLSDEGAGK